MRTEGQHGPEIITPMAPRHVWRILKDEEIELLTRATLEVLESVGVHLPLPRALEIFAEHGAKVDYESQIVRLPPELVGSA